MKKRILVLGMCIVMAFSMTACGKDKKSSDSGNVGKISDKESHEAVMTGTEYKADVTLPDIKAIKVGESVTAVDESDVRRIDCLLLGYFDVDTTNIGRKEGTVAEYDVVNIDYVGTLDGTEFEGGSATDFNLGIGTNTFIDGFEEGLIGAKTGDTVELNLTFPDSYQNTDLAGKEVVFSVKVNYIAELTDEFIKDNESEIIYMMYEYFSTYNDYDSADDFYAAVRNGLKVYNVIQKVFQQIQDESVVEPDAEALAAFIADKKQSYIDMAESSGQTLEDILPMYLGMSTEEEFDEYLTDIYKSYAVIFAIANQENIEISEEEYDLVVQAMVETSDGQYDSVEAFQEDYPKQTTVDDMICGKVYYKITELVSVVPDSEIETEEQTEDAETAQEGETSAEDGETAESESSEVDNSEDNDSEDENSDDDGEDDEDNSDEE